MIGAYGTRRGIGQVLTFLAEDDIPLDPAHGVGQGKGLILGKPDDEIGEALSAFRADTGSLLNSWMSRASDGAADGIWSLVMLQLAGHHENPGIFIPPVNGPIFWDANSWALDSASFTAAATRS